MSIKVTGLNKAVSAMRKIQSGEFVKKPLTKFDYRVKKDVKEYPHALDPSWRRTGTLKRHWWSKVSDSGVMFTNPARSKYGYYAGYVQEETDQVWWHARTGWKTIQSAVGDHMGKLRDDIVKEIKKLL